MSHIDSRKAARETSWIPGVGAAGLSLLYITMAHRTKAKWPTACPRAFDPKGSDGSPIAIDQRISRLIGSGNTSQQLKVLNLLTNG